MNGVHPTRQENKGETMRSLVVDNNLESRSDLQRILSSHGSCDVAEGAPEALDAVERCREVGEVYDLICLAGELPAAQQTLRELRRGEEEHGTPIGRGARVVVIAASDDPDDFCNAFRSGAEGYLAPPVSRERLLQQLGRLGLLVTA